MITRSTIKSYCVWLFWMLPLPALGIPINPISIAQEPLSLAKSSNTNILFILDNTGSMTFTDAYRVDHDKSRNKLYDKSSDVNSVYYNPTIYYPPWQGEKNQPILQSYDGRDQVNGLYYRWNDTNNNNRADNVDSYKEYLISPSSSLGFYPGGPLRHDCKDPERCTLQEEAQNFSNWAYFYNTRGKQTIAALTEFLISINSDVRIGISGLPRVYFQDVIGLNQPVGPMNDPQYKADLIDQVYHAKFQSNSSNLHYAIDKAGKYFQCAGGGIFGKQRSRPGDANCPILSKAEGGSCQKNILALITDGVWNDEPYYKGNDDADNNSGFDGGAFSGTMAGTLADIAMHYYEKNLQPTLRNQVPVTSKDRNWAKEGTIEKSGMHQHMETYILGLAMLPLKEQKPPSFPQTSFFDWPKSSYPAYDNRVIEMLHAAYNGRGEFFQVYDYLGIKQALQAISKKIYTNAAANGSNSLVLNGDRVYRTTYDFENNSGDVIAQSLDSYGYLSKPIWSAATKMDSLGPSHRVIMTYPSAHMNVNHSTAVPFRPDKLFWKENNKIDFLRGDRSEEGDKLRRRKANEGLLGDIINSTPQYIGAPSQTSLADKFANYRDFMDQYQERTGMLAVGSNDGMLHVFRADSGTELFAYVPSWLIDTETNNLLSSFPEATYVHNYLMDGTPKIADVYRDSQAQWRTVLVGGTGLGGRGFFALDITDPKDWSLETTAAKQVLWEFDKDDDPDMGYSTSQPLIMRSNWQDAADNPRWVTLFGNGYNSQRGNAVLFINQIDGIRYSSDGTAWIKGNNYIALDTKTGPDGNQIANGLGAITGFDKDKNGTIDYVYAGDLQGNLYRFDLSSSDPSQWSSHIIFKAKYSSTEQPIALAPAVIQDTEYGPSKGVVVMAATGTWFRDEDDLDTHTQSLYAVWDDWKPNRFVNQTDLLPRKLIAISNEMGNIASFEKPKVNACGSSSDPFCIDWRKNKGWKLDFTLNEGERAFANLLVEQGPVVTVTTVFPIKKSKPCDNATTAGYQLSFNPITGGDFGTAIVDYNNDGIVDENDNCTECTNPIISGGRVDGGSSGVVSDGGIHISQIDGQIIIRKVKLPESLSPRGRKSWREIE